MEKYNLKTKCLSELIGSFVVMFFSIGSVLFLKNDDYLSIAIASGLIVAITMYLLFRFSGCNINPAVSFSLVLLKRMKIKTFFLYVLMQVLGAVLASLVLLFIASQVSIGSSSLLECCGGYDELSKIKLTLSGAFLSEIILAFIVVFSYLWLFGNKKLNENSELIFGLVVFFVVFISMPLTNSFGNLAKLFGTSIVFGCASLSFTPLAQLPVLIIASILGVFLAIFIYKAYNPYCYVESSSDDGLVKIKKAKKLEPVFFKQIAKMIRNYFNFRGCASRAEFWYPFVLICIISICYGIFSLDNALYQATMSWFLSMLMLIANLFFTIPMIALTCRRLHDVGKSGLWFFLNFVPFVGAIILLVWCAKPSIKKA